MTSIDLDALGAWMDDEGLPGGAIHAVDRLGGGTQNLLVRFARGGERYVLRHPPEHKRPNSDETMRREARVLGALAGTDVPHPALIAACGDESVLGSAFYLMEPVDGANPTVALPQPYLDRADWRRQLGLAMADGAAAVGAVDHLAVGLADFGKPEGYLERQVVRWTAQLDSYSELAGYPGPDLPGVEEVGAWLEDNRPTTSQAGLMHGDFHLANVLCAPDQPQLAAIVDWELATIGDPLLDLGWLLATWPGEEQLAGTTVEPWDGFPQPADLITRYAERSGRDLSAISWYEVMACFKLGIILEGSYARAGAGLAPKQVGDALRSNALVLFRRALARIASS